MASDPACDKQADAYKLLSQTTNWSNENNALTAHITAKEVRDAIKHGSFRTNRKAPGGDHVCNELLRHLPALAHKERAILFNKNVCQRSAYLRLG